LVVVAVIGLGTLVHTPVLVRVCGGVLLAFAAFHAVYGRRHSVRIGMQAGLAGLLVWSFLMANAHGAGLMVIPALFPICASGSSTDGLLASGSVLAASGALAVHSAAMLAAIGAISIAVYRWVGLGFLRNAWVNLDWVWTILLGACGAALLLS
jgi:hypothetical protein